MRGWQSTTVTSIHPLDGIGFDGKITNGFEDIDSCVWVGAGDGIAVNAQGLERRLAAIFYADVAGYSRLTGADEDGTHRRLSEYLDLIASAIGRHGGRVVHYAGDAVLAEFVTVSSSLTCAAAIQQKLAARNEELADDRKVQFRIGLHLGEVIIDRDDIFGEGVNVAARLEALADPGGICLSESAKTAVGHKLPYVYEFMGEQAVKNIAEPVRAYRVLPEGDEDGRKAQRSTTRRPTIAVLPFGNLSGDPQQEYFVDGITDEIIIALSGLRWFFVIDRNSTFAFKGRSLNARLVAQELGVQYILEGSVRKMGSRVRVSTQLVDGRMGRNVWARRYDREVEDVFAVQDEVAAMIVGALEPELGKAERERARAKRPGNLDAWDLYQQGMWHLYRYTNNDLREARRIFRLAVEQDPNLGAAFSGMAEAYYFSLVYGHSTTPESDREQALIAARRAVQLDDEDPTAHCALGRTYYVRREHDLAIPELEIALTLNPSLAGAHYGIGAAHVFSGQASKAFPHLENAVRLSPRDPNMGSFLVRMADANLFLSNYDETISLARRALHQPNFQWSRYAVLLSALGHLGRLEETQGVLEELRAKRPDFSLEFVKTTHLFVDAGYMAHYLEGLRMAGVS
jgi:adenylate cyclase